MQHRRMSPRTAGVRGALSAAAELVWPLCCAGCGTHGHVWCPACEDEGALLCPEPMLLEPDEGGGPGAGPVIAASELTPAVGRAVVSWKDSGRRDVEPLFAAALAEAVRLVMAVEASRGGPVRGPVLLVPVPYTARAVRRRGERPMWRLTARAAASASAPDRPVCWAAPLRFVRTVADQRRLGRAGRATNLHRSMGVVPAMTGLPASFPLVIVVDDVHTTGATAREAARACAARR